MNILVVIQTFPISTPYWMDLLLQWSIDRIASCDLQLVLLTLYGQLVVLSQVKPLPVIWICIFWRTQTGHDLALRLPEWIREAPRNLKYLRPIGRVKDNPQQIWFTADFKLLKSKSEAKEPHCWQLTLGAWIYFSSRKGLNCHGNNTDYSEMPHCTYICICIYIFLLLNHYSYWYMTRVCVLGWLPH